VGCYRVLNCDVQKLCLVVRRIPVLCVVCETSVETDCTDCKIGEAVLHVCAV